MAERLIKVGNLRTYIGEVDREKGSTPTLGRITISIVAQLKPRPAISYILGGPFDDQYQSKRQQKKLLRVAMVKARVNAVHLSGSMEETKPIDDPISFPPINPNKVIMLRYDALVLTLCINYFDVHMVLVDPSSAAYLLQLPAFN